MLLGRVQTKQSDQPTTLATSHNIGPLERRIAALLCLDLHHWKILWRKLKSQHFDECSHSWGTQKQSYTLAYLLIIVSTNLRHTSWYFYRRITHSTKYNSTLLKYTAISTIHNIRLWYTHQSKCGTIAQVYTTVKTLTQNLMAGYNNMMQWMNDINKHIWCVSLHERRTTPLPLYLAVNLKCNPVMSYCEPYFTEHAKPSSVRRS